VVFGIGRREYRLPNRFGRDIRFVNLRSEAGHVAETSRSERREESIRLSSIGARKPNTPVVGQATPLISFGVCGSSAERIAPEVTSTAYRESVAGSVTNAVPPCTSRAGR